MSTLLLVATGDGVGRVRCRFVAPSHLSIFPPFEHGTNGCHHWLSSPCFSVRSYCFVMHYKLNCAMLRLIPSVSSLHTCRARHHCNTVSDETRAVDLPNQERVARTLRTLPLDASSHVTNLCSGSNLHSPPLQLMIFLFNWPFSWCAQHWQLPPRATSAPLLLCTLHKIEILGESC